MSAGTGKAPTAQSAVPAPTAGAAAPLGSRYLSLRLARRMRHAQHAFERLLADAPGLTLDGLLNLHGQSGIPTLLMLFALFCIVPVGGVGNVFGVALWMLSWDVWQGRSDMRLPNRLASFRLNRRWSIHMLHGLGSGYRQASRWLRPRWPAMQAPWTRGPWALWIALQALIIFLPVPLGNILPAFSLIALGLGQIIKDGMLLWASLLLGALATLYMWWLGDITWSLVLATWAWLAGG